MYTAVEHPNPLAPAVGPIPFQWEQLLEPSPFQRSDRSTLKQVALSNEAIRSARGGWPRGRKLLEKAMSEELGNSPAPAELADAVEQRLRTSSIAR